MSRGFLICSLALCFLSAQMRVGLARQQPQQQPASPNAQTSDYAAKIKQKIQKLKPDTAVTVFLIDGREFYGSIKSVEPQEFLLADRQTKQLITFRYDQVRKISKLSNDTRRTIIPLVILGAVIGLVVIVLASDKS